MFGQDPLWLAWANDLINFKKAGDMAAYNNLLATVTPARFKVGQMIGATGLLLGVGAALHYDNPEDVQSVEMRRLVEKEGVKAALARIASLPDTDPLLPLAAQAYDEVERIIAKIPEAQ